ARTKPGQARAYISWPQHSNKQTRSGVPYVADLQRVLRIKTDAPFLILTKLSYSVDCASVPDESALGWVPVGCWFDCLMVVLQWESKQWRRRRLGKLPAGYARRKQMRARPRSPRSLPKYGRAALPRRMP